MNILHITNMTHPTKFGGLERWLNEVCRYAKTQGDKVFISYTDSIGEVKPYADAIAENSGALVVLANDEHVKDFCARNKIDIVHIHFGFEGYKEIYGHFKKNHIRTFLHLHCENYPYLERHEKRSASKKLRVLLHRIKTHFTQYYFEKILPCSEVIRGEYLYMYHWKKEKIITHYFGIEQKELEKVQSDTVPVISNIAFHAEVKGIDILLNVLKILKDRGCDFKCLQIGGGDNSHVFHELCRDLGLDGNVQWVGITNNVYTYLAQSDIYIQPSRSEALPLSIAEAMQCGLPVLASDVGGVSELVQNGINGYRESPNAPEAFADRLQELINNAELRSKMGDASRSMLEEKAFFINKSVEKLWKYYK